MILELGLSSVNNFICTRRKIQYEVVYLLLRDGFIPVILVRLF